MNSIPHLLNPILPYSSIEAFFTHPFVSTITMIGLLLMIGTLLAEYTIPNDSGNSKAYIKKKRILIWSLFVSFLLCNAIRIGIS